MSGSTRIENIADARREATRLKQELDDTYKRYKTALSGVPIDFQGDVHKYMCIRLSGYLEQLFFVCVTGYIKSSPSPRVATFALQHFRYAPNMSPGNLERLIEKFGDEWSADLKLLLDDAGRRESLGNLLSVRNTTAHGGNYKGSAPQVETYKQLVEDLHNWALRSILV
jgi:hypothetical protein